MPRQFYTRSQWREGQFKSTNYPLLNSNYWAINALADETTQELDRVIRQVRTALGEG